MIMLRSIIYFVVFYVVTALYLVSLQVAAERGRLEAIDRKIAQTRRDIRQLQTEMGTRASLRQLERWNGDVLALSAPQAEQFLPSEAALDRINPDEIGRKPAAPPPVMVAASQAAAPSATSATPGLASNLLAALGQRQEPPKLSKQDRTIQAAIAPKVAPPAQRADVALIDRDALAKLGQSESVKTRATKP